MCEMKKIWHQLYFINGSSFRMFQRQLPDNLFAPKSWSLELRLLQGLRPQLWESAANLSALKNKQHNMIRWFQLSSLVYLRKIQRTLIELLLHFLAFKPISFKQLNECCNLQTDLEQGLTSIFSWISRTFIQFQVSEQKLRSCFRCRNQNPQMDSNFCVYARTISCSSITRSLLK